MKVCCNFAFCEDWARRNTLLLPCSFLFNRRHRINGFSTIDFLAAVSLGSYGKGFSTAALIAFLSAKIAENASPYQRYCGYEELLSQAKT